MGLYLMGTWFKVHLHVICIHITRHHYYTMSRMVMLKGVQQGCHFYITPHCYSIRKGLQSLITSVICFSQHIVQLASRYHTMCLHCNDMAHSGRRIHLNTCHKLRIIVLCCKPLYTKVTWNISHQSKVNSIGNNINIRQI